LANKQYSLAQAATKLTQREVLVREGKSFFQVENKPEWSTSAILRR